MLLLVGTIVVYIYEDVAGDMVAKQPQQLMVRPLEIDAMLSFDCRSCGSGRELQ